jgi:DNA polymerase elongation subunit (family B)
MLLDIEQRKNEVIVSYYNTEGEVAFKRYPIDEFQNWYVCDDKDRAKHPTYKNWDDKSVKLGGSRNFNKFSLVYFMDSLPEKDRAEIHAYNMPKTYFVDIETEIVDGFPKPEEAKSRILTFSIITPNKQAIVLGLEDLSDDKIKKVEDDNNEYFKDFGDEWSFKYIKFKSEYDMVYTFVHKFMPKFAMMTGWNFINYDWQYIVNRCKRLQIDIKDSAKTKEVDQTDSRPLHMGILDYMQLYDKYDRSVKVKESNRLDYVAGEVLKVQKIKFSGSFNELYQKDFTKFVYYNVVDSLLVYYIDQKLRSMEVLLTLANITQMPLYKAASPVAVTEALLARTLATRGQRIGTEPREDNKKEEQYAGAFVKDPIAGYHKGVSAFDFASLYPSIMRQFNISPDAFIEKVEVDKIKERREDKNVIVCENGVVYKTETSILKEILNDLYSKRQQYKSTSYKLSTKAMEAREKLSKL